MGFSKHTVFQGKADCGKNPDKTKPRIMKKLIPIELSLFSSLFFALLCVQSCTPPQTTVVQVKTQYAAALIDLDKTAALWLRKVEEKAPESELREAFLNTRTAYKKVEFLSEYYFSNTSKAINGAPIDEVEEDAPDVVIPPSGFQVAEEFMYPYRPETHAELLTQAKLIRSVVTRLILTNQTTEFTDSHIFDATRLEIFRVLTLGLSGFDSPIAQQSIPEAASALASLKTAFTVYSKNLEAKNSSLNQAIHRNFDEAIAYLGKHTDFNSFDRLTFISEYANPLSAGLLEAQKTLGIPVLDDIRALRADAKHLFEPNAFDVDFFAPYHENHLSLAKAELGAKLFYDAKLSGGGSRTCATCHQPDKGFTDGLAKSRAFDNKKNISRNAPTILNAGLQAAYFYDSRATFLEDQASDVIANKDEMHGSLEDAVKALSSDKDYVGLFNKAFPKDQRITPRNLQIAIASYTRSLTSLNSRFDRYVRGEKTLLDDSEKRGFNLFMGKAKCGTCHFMPLFNGTIPPAFTKSESEVIGVPKHSSGKEIDPDLGKYHLYKAELHKYSFKTTTVRNIALTAPYMHNGVYRTLEEVVDFYNKGGGAGMGMDLPNQTLPFDKLNLTKQEQQDVVAFMKTLTDTSAAGPAPKKSGSALALK